MNFTDRVRMYQLVGSQQVPDAESLAIPLMRLQFIGVPIRGHDGEDWRFITWQNLDWVVLQHDFMRGWYFRPTMNNFVVVAVLA